MIDFNSFTYYIRPGFTDMRKSAPTLAAIVESKMQLQPFSKSVFVFCGRNRKTIKAIFWDRNGWFEIIKRLECPMGFKWPVSTEEAMHVSLDQIIMMLEGNDAFRAFPAYSPQYV